VCAARWCRWSWCLAAASPGGLACACSCQGATAFRGMRVVGGSLCCMRRRSGVGESSAPQASSGSRFTTGKRQGAARPFVVGCRSWSSTLEGAAPHGPEADYEVVAQPRSTPRPTTVWCGGGWSLQLWGAGSVSGAVLGVFARSLGESRAEDLRRLPSGRVTRTLAGCRDFYMSATSDQDATPVRAVLLLARWPPCRRRTGQAVRSGAPCLVSRHDRGARGAGRREKAA